MRKQIKEIIYIPFLLIILCEYISTNSSQQMTYIYMSQVLLIYTVLLIKAIRRYSFFDLYSLFLVMMGFFTFGGVYFDLLMGGESYKEKFIGTTITIPEEVVQKAALYYAFFLLIFDYFVCYFKRKIQIPQIHMKFSPQLYDIGSKAMMILYFFAIYRAYLQFQSLGGDRMAYFAEGVEALGLPLYVRICSSLFYVAYLFVISSSPTIKKFVFWTLLYITTEIPSLMLGNRMAIGQIFVFIFWYVSQYYGKKVDVRKILTIGAGLIFLLFYVGMKRMDIDPFDMTFLTSIRDFATMQSSSFTLLCLHIMYAPQLSAPYPFFLDTLIGALIYSKGGQSVDTIINRAGLGHHLVYAVDPNVYLSGSNTGTSFIAELYQFGFLGAVLGALFFAWFITYFNKEIFRNRLALFFCHLLFGIIIISPRGGMFLPIYDIIKSLLFGFIIIFVYNLFSREKVRFKFWKY